MYVCIVVFIHIIWKFLLQLFFPFINYTRFFYCFPEVAAAAQCVACIEIFIVKQWHASFPNTTLMLILSSMTTCVCVWKSMVIGRIKLLGNVCENSSHARYRHFHVSYSHIFDAFRPSNYIWCELLILHNIITIIRKNWHRYWKFPSYTSCYTVFRIKLKTLVYYLHILNTRVPCLSRTNNNLTIYLIYCNLLHFLSIISDT